MWSVHESCERVTPGRSLQCPYVGLMLDHPLRRWPNIKPTLPTDRVGSASSEHRVVMTAQVEVSLLTSSTHPSNASFFSHCQLKCFSEFSDNVSCQYDCLTERLWTTISHTVYSRRQCQKQNYNIF